MFTHLVLSTILALGIAPFGKKKPKMTLLVSPRTLMSGTTLQTVTATIIIENTNQEMWCPYIEFDWGMGIADGQQSDCSPFEEASISELRRWVTSKTIHIRPTVSAEIVVTISLYRTNADGNKGKLLMRERTSFRIVGRN